MDRRTFLAGAGCGMTAICSGCVTGTPLSPDVSESESRSYDVADGARLRVDNKHGSVAVDGADRDDVELVVEKSGRTQEALDAAEVTASESDGTLRLETTYDESVDQPRASVSLTITCPDTTHVEAATTTNGSVDVTDVAGDPTVESENGALTVENVAGTVTLTTTNGSVDAHGIGALGDVQTSNGAIDVDVPELVEDSTIETTNGAIDAALSPDLDAEVAASTTNGAIDVEVPEFSGIEEGGTSFSGTLGDGTHELDLETTNGAIGITELTE